MNKKTKNITLYSLGIATVYCATFFIKVPNQLDGYANLGDGFILLFSSIVPPFGAFMIAGIGSAMADLAGGYGHYFFFTLFIKGFQGVIVSLIARKSKSVKILFTGYILASLFMVTGYFFAKWVLKSSIAIALTGISGNIAQAIIGLVVACILYPIVKKLYISYTE